MNYIYVISSCVQHEEAAKENKLSLDKTESFFGFATHSCFLDLASLFHPTAAEETTSYTQGSCECNARPVQSHLAEKLLDWQVTWTFCYCSLKQTLPNYIFLTQVLLIPSLYTSFIRHSLKHSHQRIAFAAEVNCQIPELVFVILQKDGTMCKLLLYIFIDILRVQSRGNGKSRWLKTELSQDQREHRSFQDKDAINLFKEREREGSRKALRFLPLASADKFYHVFISWNQWIYSPTEDQLLPSLLPQLYIGMPLSEAASDHISDQYICRYLRACWRKQRKQRALYGRTDIQVSVLVKGIVGFHLQLAQASRWHGTVFQGRIVLVTPWWSAKETRTEIVRQQRNNERPEIRGSDLIHRKGTLTPQTP